MLARTSAWCLAASLLARPALAGKLDEVRQEVEDGDSAPAPSRQESGDHSRADTRNDGGRHDHGEGHDHHGDGHHGQRHDGELEDGDTLGAYLALAIVGSPFWLPHVIAGDDFQRPQAFARYPYADGHRGLLLPPAEPGAGFGSTPYEATGFVEAQGAYRNDNLWRGKLEARLHSASRVGLTASFATYLEPLDSGRPDTLSLGDAEILFTFAQSPHMLFWTGAGARVLAEAKPRFGFDWVYGFDLFIVDPLVFSTRVDLGSLGKAFVAAASARLGVFIGRFDIGVGYDTTAFGSVEIGGVTLGVRTWL